MCKNRFQVNSSIFFPPLCVCLCVCECALSQGTVLVAVLLLHAFYVHCAALQLSH